ncbi:nuclear transport factor 2 family protein [Streptomyces sp. NBC_01264]|uniref:nuclear transport factor 2 family protein n=1 Tax=Streptomyces sp. NBC_01264 TaxID=2903804 RepID=UPI002251E59F|nr:nuclear transport factor 2 family protein [Streptomyces sp. NBC_01264]MCX4783744.1 nuclear transport factor 2 family protein [Streptomyces sp. NBC_01264]
MPSIDEDLVRHLSGQLRELTDRGEISRLCDRYVSHMDRDRDDDAWLGSVFTEDAVLSFPFGEYKGIEGLVAFQEMGRSSFARSHHISANHEIDLDGDRARVRAHTLAVHLKRREDPGTHFDVGGHYEALVVRTEEGWRIQRFTYEVVWSNGEPPAVGTEG